MIHIEQLDFAYSKKQRLFEQLQLELQAGKIYGLLGKNGAGKTSLLQLMAGLLFPKSGKIKVLDHQPQERQASFLADCFLLPEDQFIPKLRIHTFVKLYAPLYPKFDYRLFDQLLKEFELDATQNLRNASLGQKKKAMLAFALASNARLLLMDEPTNGLDIPSKKQFRKIIARSIDKERTFIVSTHQVRDLQSLLDSIVVLDQGKIIFQNSLMAIMEQFCFEIRYLEPSDVLYYERVPGGYFCIQPNLGQESLEVDIEILFNAILAKGIHFPEPFNLIQS